MLTILRYPEIEGYLANPSDLEVPASCMNFNVDMFSALVIPMLSA
jgi:hypothetical protein